MKILFQEKQFTRDPLVIIPVGISIILTVLLWFVTLRFLSTAPDIIPLHYTIYFGIDLIGPSYQLLALPIGATVIVLLNSSIAARSFKAHKTLSYLLTIIGLFIISLATTALYFTLAIQQ